MGPKRLLLLPLLALLASAAPAEPWKFVVMGDGRMDVSSHRPGDNPASGINEEALKELVQETLKQHPKFVLYTGDLVAGEYVRRGDGRPVPNPVTGSLSQQLSRWWELMKPLRDAGVVILPVRGNHELIVDKERATITDPAAVWKSAFLSYLRDEAKVSFLPGEEGFSYTYVPPFDATVKIIGLDDYTNGPHAVHRPYSEIFSGTDAKNTFVFDHEMAFTEQGPHPDGDALAAKPDERAQLLHEMAKHGVAYFFAGHDHLYDHMTITHPLWPKDFVMHQYVAGTAGAPFYNFIDQLPYGGNKGDFEVTRVAKADHKLGYLLVEVDDAHKASVSFMAKDGDTYKVLDPAQ